MIPQWLGLWHGGWIVKGRKLNFKARLGTLTQQPTHHPLHRLIRWRRLLNISCHPFPSLPFSLIKHIPCFKLSSFTERLVSPCQLPAMEASAGLVAGSHNRNELVVIHGHEEVMNLIRKCSGRNFWCVFVADMVVFVLLCFLFCSQSRWRIWTVKFVRSVATKWGLLWMVICLLPAMNVVFPFADLAMSMKEEKEAKIVLSVKLDIRDSKVKHRTKDYVFK